MIGKKAIHVPDEDELLRQATASLRRESLDTVLYHFRELKQKAVRETDGSLRQRRQAV